MRHVHWTCDNCGDRVVGDARPPGWLLVSPRHTTTFGLCSWSCLAAFALKADANLPMGARVTASMVPAEDATTTTSEVGD